uniref:CLU central domain-containing protein n=1 Tax=Amphimedon queenslandica TaxID=400682 RepID=A0A1X7TLM3_AMPQE
FCESSNSLEISHIYSPKKMHPAPVVRDCIYRNISPIDGTSLKCLLHSRGINNRYIGKIAMLAKSREDLDHLHTDTEEIVSDEVAATKKKSKKKKGGGSGGGGASGPVTKTTSAGKDLSQGKLWKLLVEDVLQHFLYTLEYNSATHMCTTCGVSRVSLLREFCNKTGVQITSKDYKFSLTAPLNEGDLACIVPVVKHTDFKPLEASGLYELAQVQLQSGNIEVALDYLSGAVQLFAQVFGPQHVNIANCYKVIA